MKTTLRLPSCPMQENGLISPETSSLAQPSPFQYSQMTSEMYMSSGWVVFRSPLSTRSFLSKSGSAEISSAPAVTVPTERSSVICAPALLNTSSEQMYRESYAFGSLSKGYTPSCRGSSVSLQNMQSGRLPRIVSGSSTLLQLSFMLSAASGSVLLVRRISQNTR